ncbi:hypothetical protein L3X38_024820 [Prunus dulcis]|uniref:Uncharacterized protein n=1 Tax=Prunus dulcis TaxID=3755 RepID=A0AAD4Z5S9_PRUDU|nr:hypothetical protein L3X38_024820 [Prunus dulcis]
MDCSKTVLPSHRPIPARFQPTAMSSPRSACVRCHHALTLRTGVTAFHSRLTPNSVDSICRHVSASVDSGCRQLSASVDNACLHLSADSVGTCCSASVHAALVACQQLLCTSVYSTNANATKSAVLPCLGCQLSAKNTCLPTLSCFTSAPPMDLWLALA